MQFTAERGQSVVTVDTERLTADTPGPVCGLRPGPVRQAGHVEVLNVSPGLEVETFLLTLITHLTTELHRLA